MAPRILQRGVELFAGFAQVAFNAPELSHFCVVPIDEFVEVRVRDGPPEMTIKGVFQRRRMRRR